MGIDAPSFCRLLELSETFHVSGRSLMLGRQKIFIRGDKNLASCKQAVSVSGRDLDLGVLLEFDTFAEPLFSELGLGEIETLDLSDFEGATVLHDLNQPVPDDLKEQFQFIYDGGTLEHVFNVPVALNNLYDMLQPGGVLAASIPMNGWAGHGFYQFGPELVYTFFKHSKNATIRRCVAMPIARDMVTMRMRAANFVERLASFKRASPPWLTGKPWDLADHTVTGHRNELTGKLPSVPISMYYEIAKGVAEVGHDEVLQSDYVSRWSDHEASSKKTGKLT